MISRNPRPTAAECAFGMRTHIPQAKEKTAPDMATAVRINVN
ncbi:hypothetical protein [Streptomyces sp. Vc74B-19]|nr:hypothetical protein [Streptomyces sp. Vc74B-19]